MARTARSESGFGYLFSLLLMHGAARIFLLIPSRSVSLGFFWFWIVVSLFVYFTYLLFMKISFLSSSLLSYFLPSFLVSWLVSCRYTAFRLYPWV
jgi:hypothetical protein